MKLELVKKYEPDNVLFPWGCVALNEETAVSLVMEKDSDNYSLLLFSTEEMRRLPIDYIEAYTHDKPVLFAKNGGFGIIKNQNELFYHNSIDCNPIKIEIENKKLFQQVLPPKTRLLYPNPISDNDVLPVCFQHTTFDGLDPRYFAFLNLNIEKQKAKWESWASLDAKMFCAHGLAGKYPPKIDSVMIKDDDVFIFTSGEKITSVNKWGMDYYGIAKTTKKGEVVEILLDSGNLHAIDLKTRGVNGVFSFSQKYVILTPVFRSNEWKGKQKLFSIATGELIEIAFPRGFGKRPLIIQHSGKYFWVYLWDTKHFVICQEEQDF
jgi:hypothetical protein